jgi:hypothetical protein
LRGFVRLFQGSLIPNFYLKINAPNAIRNVLALKPISEAKHKAYSCSNSNQSIIFAILTQRLSLAKHRPKGNSKLSGGVF